MTLGFTMKGRIGRKEYVISSLIVTALTYAFPVVLGVASGASGNDALFGVAVAVAIIGLVAQSALMVRRLHDLDKPGWHYWLTLVPFYNLYLGLVLLFTEGAKVDNRYGPAPAAA